VFNKKNKKEVENVFVLDVVETGAHACKVAETDCYLLAGAWDQTTEDVECVFAVVY
jgi:hypothetical protein